MSKYNFKTNYCHESFTPEEVEKGLHIKFIKTLLSLDKDNQERYHDVHITNDGYCLIIEWCLVYFNDDACSHFEYVSEDETVATIVEYPDDSTELAWDDEMANDLLEEWLSANPGWHKNKFGVWTDSNDQNFSMEKLKDGTIVTTASTGDEPIEVEPMHWENDTVSIYQSTANKQIEVKKNER